MPPGKKSKSKKRKWKRLGEVLLSDLSLSWNRECTCSPRGRLIGGAGGKSPNILFCALMSYRTKSGGEVILETNRAAVTHYIHG